MRIIKSLQERCARGHARTRANERAAICVCVCMTRIGLHHFTGLSGHHHSRRPVASFYCSSRIVQSDQCECTANATRMDLRMELMEPGKAAKKALPNPWSHTTGRLSSPTVCKVHLGSPNNGPNRTPKLARECSNRRNWFLLRHWQTVRRGHPAGAVATLEREIEGENE